MMEGLETRYGGKVSQDELICQFHELKQEEQESIRNFASRIERAWKLVQQEFPGKYEEEPTLKERLFQGMQRNLRDSLRYMQGDPDTSYRKLLKMSVEAETERRKIQDQLIQTKKLKDKQEKVVAKATQRLEQLKKEIKQIPSHIKKEEERKRHRKPVITAAGPF